MPRVELPSRRLHDHERDQRQREHRRQLRLAEHVPELVAREAEQVAAEERGPEASVR